MRFARHIAFAAALAAFPSFAAMAQDSAPAGAAPSGNVAVGTPDLSAFGNDPDLAAAAVCDNSVFPIEPIKRYKIELLQAWTQYEIGTCKPLGPGSWTIVGQDKCDGKNCGKFTKGMLKQLALSNGQCPGKKFNFGALCYTWTTHSNVKVTDTLLATWIPPTSATGPENLFARITVPIVYPKKETTVFKGWDGEGLGTWEQTLHNDDDPNFDWSFDTVREQSGPGASPSNDTCWCSGSAFDPFYKITGGKWNPDPDGVWGLDHVGWCTANGPDFCPAPQPLPVQYYRTKRRAPCGTTFPQQMQFRAVNVSGPWKKYGKVNTLGGRFDYTNVVSIRAGKSKSHVFSPKPVKTRIACSAFKPTPADLVAAFGAKTSVDDPRPVAAAVALIQQASGKPITYEDAPIRHRFQMMPMVKGGSDDALLVPRGGRLNVVMPADKSAGNAVSAVKAAVETYNAGRSVATFAVSETALTHVVPRLAANETGRLVSVTPVLDTKVTLEPKERSALQLIGAVLQAVSEASGESVGIGTVATGQLRHTIGIGAKEQTAREILEQAILSSEATLSWRLLYDPGLKQYFLNIPVVE